MIKRTTSIGTVITAYILLLVYQPLRFPAFLLIAALLFANFFAVKFTIPVIRNIVDYLKSKYNINTDIIIKLMGKQEMKENCDTRARIFKIDNNYVMKVNLSRNIVEVVFHITRDVAILYDIIKELLTFSDKPDTSALGELKANLILLYKQKYLEESK